MIKKFLKSIVYSIYPNKCVCCGQIIDEGNHTCECCRYMLDDVKYKDICIECGFEKENCICKYNVFRFNGVISVYKNFGIARKAYYSYKFGNKSHYSDFFVEEMYQVLNKLYSNKRFDFICSVPSYKKHIYDHSGYIAQKLSKKLNIPFCSDILSCIKICKKQHKSTIKERVNNVYDKYRCNYRIENKTVLLIDDIKTTGATLDECTRMLLFAGAQSVYCLTVLGGSKK